MATEPLKRGWRARILNFHQIRPPRPRVAGGRGGEVGVAGVTLSPGLRGTWSPARAPQGPGRRPRRPRAAGGVTEAGGGGGGGAGTGAWASGPEPWPPAHRLAPQGGAASGSPDRAQQTRVRLSVLAHSMGCLELGDPRLCRALQTLGPAGRTLGGPCPAVLVAAERTCPVGTRSGFSGAGTTWVPGRKGVT